MQIIPLIERLQKLYALKGNIQIEAYNRNGESGSSIISEGYVWVSGEPHGKDVVYITSESLPDE